MFTSPVAGFRLPASNSEGLRLSKSLPPRGVVGSERRVPMPPTFEAMAKRGPPSFIL